MTSRSLPQVSMMLTCRGHQLRAVATTAAAAPLWINLRARAYRLTNWRPCSVVRTCRPASGVTRHCPFSQSMATQAGLLFLSSLLTTVHVVTLQGCHHITPPAALLCHALQWWSPPWQPCLVWCQTRPPSRPLPPLQPVPMLFTILHVLRYVFMHTAVNGAVRSSALWDVR